jgi:hypothetical protein
MNNALIIDLLFREIETELQIKNESDNKELLDDLIRTYYEFNKKHIHDSLQRLINQSSLDSLIKIYSVEDLHEITT